MSAPIVHDPRGFALPDSQRAIIRWTIYLGFSALAIGVINGLGQALNYAGVDILRFFPGMRTYYQGLTVHGVFNALVFTFSFSNGFLLLTTARGLGRKCNDALLAAMFVTLVLGGLLASFAMFTGRASVLFTFYPPLQAHWTYYLGLALAVVSTWITSATQLVMLRGWRGENPGARVPLLAFLSIATYVMWDIASVGIAVEVVFFLLPWSLGLISGVDPLFSRTLFWFTGHPIVYFWLLPIYVSWYAMVPKQAGGKLFSDTYARVVFLMFIVLSIPVGFHHQFTDPGISNQWKFAHAVLTFAVFFPSLATAFSVMYALEMGARRRGGRGLAAWFLKVPWTDPSLCAQILAMFAFMLGGITGLMNASFNMNQVVHNTAFIPGHFHLTVGTAVALSAMGIAYWLVPYLTNRKLWSERVAVVQGWLYFVGVLIFSRGMISGGLMGMPRRTLIVAAPYHKPDWNLAAALSGVGGTLMFISAMMCFFVLAMTALLGEKTEPGDLPLTETIEGPPATGWTVGLDRLRYSVAAVLFLIALAYGPFLLHHLPPKLQSPGYTFF
ncbi:MAG: cbb3-type cytochrome c oxidase subunit I [Candidatus Binatia bacterium]